MQNEGIRFLAFCLGALLLFHGLDKMVYGTGHIQKMILDAYVPDVKSKVPFSGWFSPFMPGRVFMGKIFIGKEFVSSLEEIKLISYGVFIPELIVPIFLVFGKFIRVMAFIIAAYMLAMLFVAYRMSPETLIQFGGWHIESIVLYLVASVTLILYKISDCNLSNSRSIFKIKKNKKLINKYGYTT